MTAATATATAEEAALAKRLDALDATLAAEARRLWKVRAAMDELKTSRLGLKPSQAPTGLPIAGIVEALSGADAEKAQEDKKKGGRFVIAVHAAPVRHLGVPASAE